MMQDVALSRKPSQLPVASGEHAQYLTMEVGGQLFGIPVLLVQDVLRPMRMTRTPLAPPVIEGLINLRGRIVTVLSVRKRLGLEPMPEGAKHMLAVVRHEDELYSLIIDKVGEVITLPLGQIEPCPPTLDSVWKDVSMGVYRLPDRLLIALDVQELLRT